MSRLIFLSHSAADTAAALQLRSGLLFAAQTRGFDLDIWVDKDAIRPGQRWFNEIEKAINDSDMFLIYIGERGITDWVEMEVKVAVDRAATDPNYLIVPIFADKRFGPTDLSRFVKQFQGVFDVENDEAQFESLCDQLFKDLKPQLDDRVGEPFFGLKAIDEKNSHLFFGRSKEIEELLSRLQSTKFLLVTGDSGSGKSSLVQAGLVPHFKRGSLLSERDRTDPDTIWHVVRVRPGNDPRIGLGDGVRKAAGDLQIPEDAPQSLTQLVRKGDYADIRDALMCGQSQDLLRLLLIVDQFEEVLTITPEEKRDWFIAFLLWLDDRASDHLYIVLTMRQDYVNLCNAYPQLRERLSSRTTRYYLKRMSDEGLQHIVTGPLSMAGIGKLDRETLADKVLRDVGDRPGDLALIQMALTQTWNNRHLSETLSQAYETVGRVEGALAQAADKVLNLFVAENNRAHLDALLLRLVQLTGAGGVTRRIAARAEFSQSQWSLVQKLASDHCSRLLLIGGSEEEPRVEIAHEALVTAWPYFQKLLFDNTDIKRVFDQLMARAIEWQSQETEETKKKYLATGAELEIFSDLKSESMTLLATYEITYVTDSEEEQKRREKRERRLSTLLKSAAGILLVAFGIATWFYFRASSAESTARLERDSARDNETRALAALAVSAASEHQHVDSLKLALASWPRTDTDFRPALMRAVRAIGQSLSQPRQSAPTLRHARAVMGATFNNDETQVLTWSLDRTARLWQLSTGQQLFEPLTHDGPVRGARFNRDQTRILTWSTESVARVWNAVSGVSIYAPLAHDARIAGARFSPDGARILTWSWDKTARVWDAETGALVFATPMHGDKVLNAIFGPDDRHILTRSADGTARLWQLEKDAPILELEHEDSVWGAVFSADRSQILTWSKDTKAKLWNTTSDEPAVPAFRHEGPVRGARFSPDGTAVLTWSHDGTARLWDRHHGNEIIPPLRHDAAVTGALFSVDGSRILTWSKDQTVRLWRTKDGSAQFPPLAHNDTVTGAQFSSDQSLILSWSRDHTVRIWSSVTGRQVMDSIHHLDLMRGAKFNQAHDKVLSWSRDGTVRLWDVAKTRRRTSPFTHKVEIFGSIWIADQTQILSWSADQRVRIWNSQSNEVLSDPNHLDSASINAIKEQSAWQVVRDRDSGIANIWKGAASQNIRFALGKIGSLNGAVFSPNFSSLATWSDDRIVRVWDALSGKDVSATGPHRYAIQGAVFSEDGTQLLTWSKNERAARLWSAETGAEKGVKFTHDDHIVGARFSTDGNTLLTWSNDQTARLWNVATAALRTEPMRHNSSVRGAKFSADESIVLTWSWDNTAGLWDAASSAPLVEPLHHDGILYGATFSQDESRILTWSGDGTARLWDAATGQPIAEPFRHEGEVRGAMFNSNESQILTWTSDGSVQFWDISHIPKGNLIEIACQTLPEAETTNMTDLEAQYGIEVGDAICHGDAPAPVWNKLVQ